jgi:hypothetical protein
MVNTYTLELHYDHSSEYIQIRGTDIIDCLVTAQSMFPNLLVTIPLELYEEAI